MAILTETINPRLWAELPRADRAKRVFNIRADKLRDEYVWLWPEGVDNPGDYIYCGTYNSLRRERGYGGADIHFNLNEAYNGSMSITLHGPWHSNSDSLFGHTGVDLRDKHLTRGLVSRERIYSKETYNTLYRDILYCDREGAVVGPFDRVREIGEKLANELGEKLYCYALSVSGSMSTVVQPKGTA